MLEEIHENPELPQNIVFSDECKIVLTKGPNRQQVRFWRTEAPQDVMEVNTQYQQKVNVWACIYGTDIIGPFFFYGNITGETYLQMLRDQIVPAIRELEDEKLVSSIFCIIFRPRSERRFRAVGC